MEREEEGGRKSIVLETFVHGPFSIPPSKCEPVEGCVYKE